MVAKSRWANPDEQRSQAAIDRKTKQSPTRRWLCSRVEQLRWINQLTAWAVPTPGEQTNRRNLEQTPICSRENSKSNSSGGRRRRKISRCFQPTTTGLNLICLSAIRLASEIRIDSFFSLGAQRTNRKSLTVAMRAHGVHLRPLLRVLV